MKLKEKAIAAMSYLLNNDTQPPKSATADRIFEALIDRIKMLEANFKGNGFKDNRAISNLRYYRLKTAWRWLAPAEESDNLWDTPQVFRLTANEQFPLPWGTQAVESKSAKPGDDQHWSVFSKDGNLVAYSLSALEARTLAEYASKLGSTMEHRNAN